MIIGIFMIFGREGYCHPNDPNNHNNPANPIILRDKT